jgi:glucosamine-6-phosphate deaminase
MAPPSLLVLDDHHHVGLTAAELVANRIRTRTHMRVLLPTGRTPVGLHAALRDHAADGSLPTDHVTVLGLDEYLGLGQDDPRSFRATLDRELAGLRIGRREALDGAALDPEAEAARYQAVLDTAPVDLAVLGLGRDAHVAFNEPGSRPADGVRRVTLDPQRASRHHRRDAVDQLGERHPDTPRADHDLARTSPLARTISTAPDNAASGPARAVVGDADRRMRCPPAP